MWFISYSAFGLLLHKFKFSYKFELLSRITCTGNPTNCMDGEIKPAVEKNKSSSDWTCFGYHDCYTNCFTSATSYKVAWNTCKYKRFVIFEWVRSIHVSEADTQVVEPKLSHHLHSDQSLWNFGVNGKQPQCWKSLENQSTSLRLPVQVFYLALFCSQREGNANCCS